MGDDKKLNLIVQASWESQGVQDAQQDLGKLADIAEQTGQAGVSMGTSVQGALATIEQGSAQTAVRMAAFEAKARETAASLRKLGQDVASGNKTFEEAEAEYAAAEKALEEYRQELGLVEQEVKKTSQAVDQGKQTSNSAQMAWLELSAKINIAQQAYQMIAAVARAAYDTIKEGARLEAVENTFASLAESIDETADSLKNQLRTAVNDTVSDMALMEGANRFVSMGLANTGAEAGELSYIASQLGLAFRGDAVAGMEEFALLLANQSIPRLDTFGISASRVRGRIEELMTTVPGMTRETAFMQATMEQARLTMGKIGDQTEGTAGDVARLESAVANISGSLKGDFAQAAAPAVGWLADIAQGFVDAGRAAEDAKTSVENFIDPLQETKSASEYRQQLYEVKKAIDELGSRGSPFSPLATVDTRDALLLLLADFGRTAETSDEVKMRMEQLGGTISNTGVTVNGMGVSWVELEKTMARLNNEEYLARIDEDMKSVDETLVSYQTHLRPATEATGEMIVANEDLGWSLEGVKRNYQGLYQSSFSSFVDDLKDQAAASEALAVSLAEQRDQLRLTREEQDALSASRGDYFTTAVQAGADALVSWQTVTTKTGGLLEEQQSTLDELTGAYDRSKEKIESLQHGTAGLGLTEDELNKKLGEQYEQMALIEERMTPLVGVTAEYQVVSEGWRYNQTAINEELYKAADAAGASATELALLGLATGQLSEAQAIAALKAAALQEKIGELGQAIADGMDPTEALNRLDAFQSGLESRDFTARLGIELEEGAETKTSDKIKEVLTKGVPEDFRKVSMLVDTEAASEAIHAFFGDEVVPLVEEEYETLIEADTEQAEWNVINLKDLINDMHDKTIVITTVHHNSYSGAPAPGGGGYTPPPSGAGGTPYGAGGKVHGGIPGIDSVEALLMPGEIVVPAEHAGSMATATAFISRFVSEQDYGGGVDSTPLVERRGEGIVVHQYNTTRETAALGAAHIERLRRARLDEI